MPDYKQFPLPDTAEGLTDAEILSWHVKPGDEVTVNQIVVEIETEKAAVELPVPWAGVVTELHVEPGQTVDVGTPILTIDLDPNGAPSAAPAPEAPSSPAGAEPEEELKPLVGSGPKAASTKRRPRRAATAQAAEPQAPPAPVAARSAAPEPVAPEPVAQQAPAGYVPLAKPPVRKLAKDLGIDLHGLTGTAEGGVITREDVRRVANGTVATAEAAEPVRESGSRERRVPIKGVRKKTATAMVESAFSAPHVTEFLTVDVTPMMQFRTKLKNSPAYSDVKLTPLAFAAKAVCLAVRRTPDVNATWDEEAGEIVYKDYVHLGIAAATPRGLVVPKIRDAGELSLHDLAAGLNELTTKARDGKTPPEDMRDGTISITNVGVFGVDTGTPILTPGESANFAFGAIREAPWVVDGEVVPRQVCHLAVSFDHRVVDGQQGSQFLADVGSLLSDPATAITF